MYIVPEIDPLIYADILFLWRRQCITFTWEQDFEGVGHRWMHFER